MKVFKVNPRSKSDLETIAFEIRKRLDPENLTLTSPMNVEKLVGIKMPQWFGWEPDFVETLPFGVEGYTDPQTMSVVVRGTTIEAARKGDPRSRFTVIHEFCHVVLHRKELTERLITLTLSGDRLYRQHRSQLKPYEDPEWQANFLAAALLMPKASVEKIRKASENNEEAAARIAASFQVSLSAARIRLEKLGY